METYKFEVDQAREVEIFSKSDAFAKSRCLRHLKNLHLSCVSTDALKPSTGARWEQKRSEHFNEYQLQFARLTKTLDALLYAKREDLAAVGQIHVPRP